VSGEGLAEALLLPRELDRITVTGGEAAAYLHNMLTQDVVGLAVGAGAPATMTDRMAKVLAPFFLLRTEAGVEALSDPGCAAAVAGKLKMFVFSMDAAVEDVSADTAGLHLCGAGAESVLAEVGLPVPAEGEGSHQEADGVRVVRRAFFGRPGFELVLAPGALDAIREALLAAGALAGDLATAESLRVEAGRARFGVDYDASAMPTEVGLSDAVSYSKGCYVGQEILERMRSRGTVTKLLRGLVLEGEAPAAPAEVVLEGKRLGEATSLVPGARVEGTVGLASLPAAKVEPGARVEVGGVPAVVRELPLVAEEGA
jgi:aminomethyltransferase